MDRDDVAAKRDTILKSQGLDFADAVEVFAGATFDAPDDRFEYGEIRIITVGHLRGRMVVVVWMQRERARGMLPAAKLTAALHRLAVYWPWGYRIQVQAGEGWG